MQVKSAAAAEVKTRHIPATRLDDPDVWGEFERE
jgi:hypothetical protein